VIKQHNKWTIITLENSAKVTNYLETQHKPDAIICDYNLPGNNGFFFSTGSEVTDRLMEFLSVISKDFNIDLYKLAFHKKN
jgi:CheY-like chemotaxis protein